MNKLFILLIFLSLKSFATSTLNIQGNPVEVSVTAATVDGSILTASLEKPTNLNLGATKFEAVPLGSTLLFAYNEGPIDNLKVTGLIIKDTKGTLNDQVWVLSLLNEGVPVTCDLMNGSTAFVYIARTNIKKDFELVYGCTLTEIFEEEATSHPSKKQKNSEELVDEILDKYDSLKVLKKWSRPSFKPNPNTKVTLKLNSTIKLIIIRRTKDKWAFYLNNDEYGLIYKTTF